MDLLQSLRVCREAYEAEELDCSLNLSPGNGKAGCLPAQYREVYLDPTLTIPPSTSLRPFWRAAAGSLLYAVRQLRGPL